MPTLPTDQSPLEPLQLDADEIGHRKALLGFDDDDARRLFACREFVAGQSDRLVDGFYEWLTSVESLRTILGVDGTLERLHVTMCRYVNDLFCGTYDGVYVASRLRIGLVHKRLGVEPKFYLSAVQRLHTLLIRALARHLDGKPDRVETLLALDKLMHLDSQLVFDTYIRGLLVELEIARDDAIRLSQSLEQKVADRTRELQELARRDPLTGLFNRRYFMESLTRELVRAHRSSKPLSLLYLDVDQFKQINDRHGHLAGDAVLQAVARFIHDECRAYDLPCRYGGDEFCVALPETALASAQDFARRFTDALSRHDGKVRLSIGVAQSGPDRWLDAPGLIGRADLRMYRAKAAGGGICAVGGDAEPNGSGAPGCGSVRAGGGADVTAAGPASPAADTEETPGTPGTDRPPGAATAGARSARRRRRE